MKKLGNFLDKNKKTLGFLSLLLLLGIFFIDVNPVVAQNDAAWKLTLMAAAGEIAEKFMSAIAYVVAIFTTQFTTLLIVILTEIASFDNITKNQAVENGWIIVRDLCNMFFVIAFLVIAFATILRQENYSAKKLLPKLIIMAVLINFSKTFFGIIVDFSQVIMSTFVIGFSNPALIVEMLKVQDVLEFASNKGGDLVKQAATPFAVTLSTMASVVVSILMVGIIGILVGILAIRIVMLWIYTILSPIVFLGIGFPIIKSHSNKIWEGFIKQVIAGPLLAFFIWIAVAYGTTSASQLRADALIETNTFVSTANAARMTAEAEAGVFRVFFSVITGDAQLITLIMVGGFLMAAIVTMGPLLTGAAGGVLGLGKRAMSGILRAPYSQTRKRWDKLKQRRAERKEKEGDQPGFVRRIGHGISRQAADVVSKHTDVDFGDQGIVGGTIQKVKNKLNIIPRILGESRVTSSSLADFGRTEQEAENLERNAEIADERQKIAKSDALMHGENCVKATFEGRKPDSIRESDLAAKARAKATTFEKEAMDLRAKASKLREDNRLESGGNEYRKVAKKGDERFYEVNRNGEAVDKKGKIIKQNDGEKNEEYMGRIIEEGNFAKGRMLSKGLGFKEKELENLSKNMRSFLIGYKQAASPARVASDKAEAEEARNYKDKAKTEMTTNEMRNKLKEHRKTGRVDSETKGLILALGEQIKIGGMAGMTHEDIQEFKKSFHGNIELITDLSKSLVENDKGDLLFDLEKENGRGVMWNKIQKGAITSVAPELLETEGFQKMVSENTVNGAQQKEYLTKHARKGEVYYNNNSKGLEELAKESDLLSDDKKSINKDRETYAKMTGRLVNAFKDVDFKADTNGKNDAEQAMKSLVRSMEAGEIDTIDGRMFKEDGKLDRDYVRDRLRSGKNTSNQDIDDFEEIFNKAIKNVFKSKTDKKTTQLRGRSKAHLNVIEGIEKILETP